MSEKNRRVETTLSPRLYQTFLDIKEQRYTGQSNAQALRLLIVEERERIKEEEKARREHDYYLKTHAK